MVNFSQNFPFSNLDHLIAIFPGFDLSKYVTPPRDIPSASVLRTSWNFLDGPSMSPFFFFLYTFFKSQTLFFPFQLANRTPLSLIAYLSSWCLLSVTLCPPQSVGLRLGRILPQSLLFRNHKLLFVLEPLTIFLTTSHAMHFDSNFRGIVFQVSIPLRLSVRHPSSEISFPRCSGSVYRLFGASPDAQLPAPGPSLSNSDPFFVPAPFACLPPNGRSA